MRNDLNKVTIERQGNAQRQEYCDDLPGRASMQSRYSTRERKGSSLGPLKRYLRAQASRGRTWDDVYSELSKGWSQDGKLWRHLRRYAIDLVARNVRLVDGKPLPAYDKTKTNFDMEVAWVHPDTGVLMPLPTPTRPKYKALPVKTLHIGIKRRFALLNGVWKIVNLTELPKLAFGSSFFGQVTVAQRIVNDAVLGSIKVGYYDAGRSHVQNLWDGDYYAVDVCGLGRKEKRQLALLLKAPKPRRLERSGFSKTTV